MSVSVFMIIFGIILILGSLYKIITITMSMNNEKNPLNNFDFQTVKTIQMCQFNIMSGVFFCFIGPVVPF